VRLARRLLLALWAGVLVSVGGLVAPTLFAVLNDRRVAGALAAELFRRTTFLSVVVALALIALGYTHRGWRRLTPLVPALLLLASEFGVRPMLVAARGTGSDSHVFIVWHALATALYVVAAFVAVVLLCRDLRDPRDTDPGDSPPSL
jgi:hypothetical protein